jgi:hypothetical protein
VNDVTRTLTHAEFLYGAGERELAQEVFTTLGCRVVDRGGTFFTAFIEPSESNYSSNVFYASEVTAEQQAFELALRASAGPESAAFLQTRRAIPQRAYHCGFRVPSEAALDAVAADVLAAGASGPLAGRIDVAGVFRPGDPGAIAPNMVQLFVWTDVLATGLLTLGQILEVQWHLDAA